MAICRRSLIREAVLTRECLAAWLETPSFQNTIISIILFNAIILGLETSQTVMTMAGPLVTAMDKICLTIFVVEIVLKLIAHDKRFFASGWNLCLAPNFRTSDLRFL